MCFGQWRRKGYHLNADDAGLLQSQNVYCAVCVHFLFRALQVTCCLLSGDYLCLFAKTQYFVLIFFEHSDSLQVFLCIELNIAGPRVIQAFTTCNRLVRAWILNANVTLIIFHRKKL